jgi:hypothetical protein
MIKNLFCIELALYNFFLPQRLQTSTPLTPAKMTKEIVYKCKKCDFKTTKVEEQKKHHCSPTSCPYCDRTFKNNLMAGPHIRKHKLDALEREFNVLLKKGDLTNDSEYCVKCSKHISLTVLDLHHKIHGEGGGFYFCGTCKMFFVTKYALFQHSKDNCAGKIKSISAPELDTPQSFRCGHCSLCFGSLAELLAHNKIVHKDLFMCSDCGLSFKSRISLLKHIDTVHKNRRIVKTAASTSHKHVCHFCDFTAATMGRLVKHILNIHPEIEKEIGAKVVGESPML